MAKNSMRVKILEVGEKENVTDSFIKREVVGVIEGEYPEFFKFEFVQGNVDVPENLIEGTYATIYYNLKGRKVESKKKGEAPKYFISLQGWKIDVKVETA
jgi:hypothetical protein